MYSCVAPCNTRGRSDALKVLELLITVPERPVLVASSSSEDEGVEGVICGRAIYTGDLDFAAGQARADEING